MALDAVAVVWPFFDCNSYHAPLLDSELGALEELLCREPRDLLLTEKMDRTLPMTESRFLPPWTNGARVGRQEAMIEAYDSMWPHSAFS
jgi:hypothetical protein